jgi:hypothetical protein
MSLPLTWRTSSGVTVSGDGAWGSPLADLPTQPSPFGLRGSSLAVGISDCVDGHRSCLRLDEVSCSPQRTNCGIQYMGGQPLSASSWTDTRLSLRLGPADTASLRAAIPPVSAAPGAVYQQAEGIRYRGRARLPAAEKPARTTKQDG